MGQTGVFSIKPVYGPTYAAEYTVGWSLLYLLEAIPLGIVSGLLGLVTMILKVVFARIVVRVQQRLRCGPAKSRISMLLTPILGGVTLGALAVAVPLTLGDGNMPLKYIMFDGYSSYWNNQQYIYGNSSQAIQKAKQQIYYNQTTAAITEGWPNPPAGDRMFGPEVLFATLFVKMVTFALSSATGFVGGIMFPFFFIGAVAGNLAAQLTGVNQSFACIAMMMATPTAFAPVPFLFLVLSTLLFLTTAYQTGAIFIAMLTSYTIVSGCGVLLRLSGMRMPEWSEHQPLIAEELDLKRS
jgi:H+/Cl- antiporter ClcA